MQHAKGSYRKALKVRIVSALNSTGGFLHDSLAVPHSGLHIESINVQAGMPGACECELISLCILNSYGC